ncbi:MAG: ATP-binding protein [Patescibacteria group bacterium]|jgi:signal transduction histidine kinase
MDIINLVIAIVLLSNALLGFFIYKNNSRALVNRSYIFVIITILFWGVGMIFYRMVDQEYVTLWCKLLYTFATFTTPTFLIFSFIFPKGKLPSKKEIFIMVIFFIVINYLILFSDAIISSAEIPKQGENIIHFGNIYYLYVLYFFSHFFYAFAKLFFKMRKSNGVQKVQIKYVFLGYFIATNLAFATNLTLPWAGIFVYNWAGQVLTIIMVGFTTYAIIKYRLMNIRLIITRSILYAVLVGAVAAFFALSVIVVGELIGGNTRSSKIITYIATSFIVVIFLEPVKRTWAKLTDNIFYKDKVDYQEVLRQVGNVVAREIDLYKLLKGTSQLLAEKLKIKQISSFVPNTQGEFHLLASSVKKELDIVLVNDVVNYLQTNKRILIVEELIRDLGGLDEKFEKYKILDNFVSSAEKQRIEMVVPIVESDNLTAILIFDAKQSGDLYAQDDINFLELLSPQIATAIEKSKLYEEVEELNKELQKKVEDRTKSLKEANIALEDRNKFLTTIQVVTNNITRTLNLKKVNQMIADSIASEVGYIGGMLSFVDSSGKYLKVGAITNNEQSRKAFHILSKEPRDYATKIEIDYNLGAQTFLTGKINFSDKLSDFLCPPVDKKEIEEIQQILGIKTIVGIPVFSEAKIIGVIHFYLAVKREKISSLDIEIMTALANQVGIVFRNLKLYNTLQGANAELQDANTKLRELDKAKSEFLSIASHQLRTPISAIKGYLSMIIDGDFGKIPKSIDEVIRNIFESSARLARLINIFLNVSRIESGRLKLDKRPIQINDLIKGVIVELINQAKQKGLKLEYKKKKQDPPLIFADADKLREVVLNLIDNAIKYTPEGSIIVTVDSDDKELNFRVKDTGIGIKKEEAKSLFRKFVRGSGVAQIHTGGSGLGLFIAQKIIKEHDGMVWAESEGSGKGSLFQFTIPVYKKHDVPAYKEEAKEGMSSDLSS